MLFPNHFSVCIYTQSILADEVNNNKYPLIMCISSCSCNNYSILHLTQVRIKCVVHNSVCLNRLRLQTFTQFYQEPMGNHRFVHISAQSALKSPCLIFNMFCIITWLIITLRKPLRVSVCVSNNNNIKCKTVNKTKTSQIYNYIPSKHNIDSVADIECEAIDNSVPVKSSYSVGYRAKKC